MRSLRNLSKSITAKNNQCSKSRCRYASLDALRKQIKKAIEQENISVVRDFLSLSSTRESDDLADNEINTDLGLVSQAVTNFIETSNENTNKTSMTFKRPASYEIGFSYKKRGSKKLEWQRLGNGWRRWLRVDNVNDNALHYASRLGKTCFIDMLLEMGEFYIDQPNWSTERDTALGIACEFGWLDTAKLLMARGANVNYENACGKTPLILATELIAPFDLEMCKMLINHGADVNYSTSNGTDSCALLSACSYDNNELIRYLISSGASIEPRARGRSSTPTTSPLMRCVFNGNLDMVLELIAMNANFNQCNMNHQTPLYVACFRGYLEIACILVDQYEADLNSRDYENDTPLSAACFANHIEIVRFLLSRNANINTQNNQGNTPLHIAINYGHEQIALELISRGADVNVFNNQMESALHLACRAPQTNIFHAVLERSTNLNAVSLQDFTTPLRFLLLSLQPNRVEMAIALLRSGCNPIASFQPEFIYPSNLDSLLDLRSLMGHDLILESLLQLPMSCFNFDPNTRPSSLTADLLPFNKFLMLLILIIKSGYQPSRRDIKMFSNSWLWRHLESSRPQSAKYMSDLFSSPRSLKDLCRIELKMHLSRPLKGALNFLGIPVSLKAFLTMDIID